MIFSNSSKLSIDDATKLIQEKLVSGEFFVPKEWNLLTLYFHPYDPELDHDYHEFESWEETYEKIDHPKDVQEFIKQIHVGK